MKDTYCRQKYLLNSNYNETYLMPIAMNEDRINEIPDYDQPYNLFDCNGPYRRKITVSYLDEETDTKELFNEIASMVVDVDELFIVNDRSETDNSIIQDYSEASLKAYVYLFTQYGVPKVTVLNVFDSQLYEKDN